MTGTTSTFLDANGDGWDDIWCALYGYNQKNKDTVTSTSGDGISDYDKMLLRLDPRGKHPFPVKLTAEQIAAKDALAATVKLVAPTTVNDPASQAKTEEARKHVFSPTEVKQILKNANQQALDSLLQAREAAGTVDPPKQGLSAVANTRSGIDTVHDAPYGLTGLGVGVAVFVKLAENSSTKPLPTLCIEEAYNHPDLNTGTGGVRVDWSHMIGVEECTTAHSAAVVGQLMASGNTRPNAIGAAPAVSVRLWNADRGVGGFAGRFALAAADDNIIISLNSYGRLLGWDSKEEFPGPDHVTLRWDLGWMDWTGPSDREMDEQPYGAMMWYGVPPVTIDESNLAGQYDAESAAVDTAIAAHPEHTAVVAAGNFLNSDNSSISVNPLTAQDPPMWFTLGNAWVNLYAAYKNDNADKDRVVGYPVPPSSSNWPKHQGYSPLGAGYDTLTPGAATAKNTLTVGNARLSINPPYTALAWSPTSACGPTDDGRIKPDLLASGTDETLLLTATEDGTGTGTSYAAAVVAGGLALVQGHTETLGLPTYAASTTKALAVHCADRIYSIGPNYKTGYGVFQAKPMCDLISKDVTWGEHQFIKEAVVTTASNVSFRITAAGPLGGGGTQTTVPMKVTACWTDPGGDANDYNSHNHSGTRLKNKLHLQVVKAGENPHYPWRLNPIYPHQNALNNDVNDRDNLQMVDFDAVPGTVYQVIVSRNGTLVNGAQPVSIVMSGIEPYMASMQRSAPVKPRRIIDPIGPLLDMRNRISAGNTYSFESSTDLENWTTEQSDLSGNTDEMATQVAFPSSDKAFYRLVNDEGYESIPQGYVTKTLPPSQYSLVGLTLHEPLRFTGTITAVTATSITVGSDLVALLGAGSAENTHILELGDGTTLPITAWTSGGVVTTPEDLTSRVTVNLNENNTICKIRKAATVASIFGDHNEAGLTADTGGNWMTNGTDTVMIPNASGSFDTVYYYDDGTDAAWLDDQNALVANKPILYTKGFYVHRQAGATLNLLVCGEVKLDATRGTLHNGFNFLNAVAPVGLTLALSGLESSIDWQEGEADTVFDEIQVLDGVWTTYYFYDDPNDPTHEYTGWWSDTGNPADGVILNGGMLINKVGAGTSPLIINIPMTYYNL